MASYDEASVVCQALDLGMELAVRKSAPKDEEPKTEAEQADAVGP